MAAGGRPQLRQPKVLVAAAVLGCFALVWLSSRGSSVSGVPPTVVRSDTTCSWSPYLLPLAEQKWAIDAARQQVPTVVREYRRLLSVQLAQGALLQGVPGDFVETGVFRGGTAILLLQTLAKYDVGGARKLWAADSFQGLPDPVDQDQAGDTKLETGARGEYSSPLDDFNSNLKQFGVDLNRLEVLKGWFNETLPGAPIKTISFLRLDGDLYVSTMDALKALYDRVSDGAPIYIDDYGSFAGCQRAVNEFRAARGVKAPLQLQALPELGFQKSGEESTWEAAWWIKEPSA